MNREGVLKSMADRRAARTSEQILADDAFTARMDAGREFWARLKQPDVSWHQAAAEAVKELNIPDLFDGPGVVDGQTVTMPDVPLYRLLRDAVARAGLRGVVRLHAELVKFHDRLAPVFLLAVTDPAVLPEVLRRRSVGNYRDWDSGVLDKSVHAVNRVLGLEVECVYDAVGLFLSASARQGQPNPMMEPLFFSLTEADPDGPPGSIPLARAWDGRTRQDGKSWSPLLRYDDLHRHDAVEWPGQTYSSPDLLFGSGIVTVWPPTGDRVLIRAIHRAVFEDYSAPYGDRLVVFEKTDSPLTPTDSGGSLTLFGRSAGRGLIPTINSMDDARLIFNWVPAGTDSRRVRVTSTQYPDGWPRVFWLDRS